MVLSGLALLCFVALVFLGLDYRFEGELLVPITLTVVGCIAVVKCLVNMCKWKQTLTIRKGIGKEIGAAVLTLVLLVLGSVPFTNFLMVLDHEDEFRECVDSTIITIKNIAPAYKEYATERVDNYRRYLTGLSSRSSAYYNDLANASGETKTQKVNALVGSLKRRLFPEEMTKIEEEREVWLEGLRVKGEETDSVGGRVEMSVWNIFTPKNVALIGNAGNSWVEEYRAVSEKIYSGETAVPFEMDELNNQLRVFEEKYTRFSKPDIRSLVAVLICYGLLLTPYILIRRSKKASRGTGSSGISGISGSSRISRISSNFNLL